MAQPQSHLLTCPDKAVNQLGQMIMSHDLIAGLRRLNNNIVVPEPDETNWRPRKLLGMTVLWYGKPRAPTSRLITAIHLGAIPEYTQIDADSGPLGEILRKGWREIFRRVMARTPITQIQLEREFRVTLEMGKQSAMCSQCAKEGVSEYHNGGKRGLCGLHDPVAEQVEVATASVRHQRWEDSRTNKTKVPSKLIMSA